MERIFAKKAPYGKFWEKHPELEHNLKTWYEYCDWFKVA